MLLNHASPFDAADLFLDSCLFYHRVSLLIFVTTILSVAFSRATNSSSDRARLNVDAREVEVLRCIAISVPRKLQDAQVPIRTVRRS